MFWRFVLGAVRFRRRRLLLAFSAMAVAATLVTVLLSMYSDIERKMRSQFRGYGANLIIAPAEQSRTIPLRAVAEAERLGAAAAPFRYTVGELRGEPVVVAGIDFGRLGPFSDYWDIQGARTAVKGECLIGTKAASHFHLALGQRVELGSGPCVVRGIVNTGSGEDAQVMVPLEQEAASLIEVRGDGKRLEQIRAALAKALPDADVRVLRAVAETEANVVLKLRASLYWLTGLVLTITALCVTSSFSTLVIERYREIGVLKAIGAAEDKIVALFLVESLILALGSAIAGYWVGLGLAYAIGQRVFPGAAVGVDYQVFPLVAATTLAVAIMATIATARKIWRIEPAIILRGE